MTARFRKVRLQTDQFVPQTEPATTWEAAPVTPMEPRARVNWAKALQLGIALLAGLAVGRLINTGGLVVEAPIDEKVAIFGDTTSVWPSCWPDECEGDFAVLDVGQVNATAIEDERYCIGGGALKWLEPVEYPPGMTTLVIKTVCTKGSSYVVR
jgi:hypothetical protein